jgi:bifunctional polynucleotide phosphatase/kinase
MTPENLFLGDKTKVTVQGFEPASIPSTGKLFSNSNDSDVNFVEKEMAIFCGAPGCGKSTFLRNHMGKYERINRDTLKTKEKCYAVAEGCIKEGKSVVIDNTCPKKEDRKYFIGLAKKHGYKVRCFYFLTPKEICFHNDAQRVSNHVRKHFSGRVGKIPINSFFKNFEKPTTDEGFYEVKEVNFIAEFNDDADKKEYLKYTRAE